MIMRWIQATTDRSRGNLQEEKGMGSQQETGDADMVNNMLATIKMNIFNFVIAYIILSNSKHQKPSQNGKSF